MNTADILTREKKELFLYFSSIDVKKQKTQKLIGKKWKASLKTQIYSVVIIKLYERNLVFESKIYIICYEAQAKYKDFLRSLNWKQVQKFEQIIKQFRFARKFQKPPDDFLLQNHKALVWDISN